MTVVKSKYARKTRRIMKGGVSVMILFIILLLIVAILTAITVFDIIVGGAVFVILFGYVIVCIALIVWIMKRRINKKKGL